MGKAKKLKESDIGGWLTYIRFDGTGERGKLKSFNNETQTAWIVYKCDNNWNDNRWKNYTAASTKYDDIKELKEENNEGNGGEKNGR